jgi:hypothetical protein
MNEPKKMFKFNFFNTHVRIYRFLSIEKALALGDLLKKTALNTKLKHVIQAKIGLKERFWQIETTFIVV